MPRTTIEVELTQGTFDALEDYAEVLPAGSIEKVASMILSECALHFTVGQRSGVRKVGKALDQRETNARKA